MNLTYLSHLEIMFIISTALFCFSYILRNMLWLRITSIIASVFTLPYLYYSQPEPSWFPIYCQNSFILINLFNLMFLLLEKVPVTLTEEQSRLYRLVFHLASKREMLALLSIAEWRELEAGRVLISQGSTSEGLLLIFRGKTAIVANEEQVAEVTEGQFIGEISLVTGETASADVVTAGPVRYLFWNRERLLHLMEKKPRLKVIMQALLGYDMAVKLGRVDRKQGGSLILASPEAAGTAAKAQPPKKNGVELFPEEMREDENGVSRSG